MYRTCHVTLIYIDTLHVPWYRICDFNKKNVTSWLTTSI